MALQDDAHGATGETVPSAITLEVAAPVVGPPPVERSGSAPATWPAPQTRPSDATRYLSAGAYLDEDFAKTVVEELFGQMVRAVAPSHGFDLRPVAIHCLAAHRSRRRRDAVLGILGVAMLVFGPLTSVLFGAFWAVFGGIVGVLRDGPEGRQRARSKSRWFGFVVAILALPITFVWALAILVALSRALGPSAANTGPAFGGIPAPVAAALGSLFVVLTLGAVLGVVGWPISYAVVLMDMIARRRTVVRRLRRAAFQERPDRWVALFGRRKAQLDAIAAGQYGNATIYSGFDPFVGAGDRVNGWSFAIPLAAPRNSDNAVKDFSVADLLQHVRWRIASIAEEVGGPTRSNGGSDDPLRGLVVTDRVFVHGLAVDERFVKERAMPPRTRLADDEIERIARDPHGAVRHYCAVHVESWDGEIVASTFFHFSTDGEKLYCQWVKRALGPVRSLFRAADFLPAHVSLGDLLGMAADAAVSTVGMVLGAPARVAGDMRGGRRLLPDTIVDYGAKLSVRELGAETSTSFGEFGCHNYFQELDVDKHLKIIERQALAAIVEFLDAHGINSAELRSRQDTILNSNINNSVTVMGSISVLGALAMGVGAQANQTGTIDAQPTVSTAAEGGS